MKSKVLRSFIRPLYGNQNIIYCCINNRMNSHSINKWNEKIFGICTDRSKINCKKIDITPTDCPEAYAKFASGSIVINTFTNRIILIHGDKFSHKNIINKLYRAVIDTILHICKNIYQNEYIKELSYSLHNTRSILKMNSVNTIYTKLFFDILPCNWEVVYG